MTVPQMKEAVCRWARQCYEEKLFAGTSGNLSVYDKEAGVMAIVAVYEAKPEAGAVIHTHSPYATAFAVNNRNIPAILIEMAFFLGGDVPLAKFAVPGTREVGTEAVKALAGRTGCLLANHGVLALGKDLEQAHLRAVYIEDAAKICSIAMSNGPIVAISQEQIDAMRG